MGKTPIQWTDETWNPVRGCVKVSPGCKHCYASTFAERFRGVEGHPYEQGFDPRLVPHKLADPLSWRAPRRVFVNSMSDLFGDFVPDEYIAAVFGVMAATPQHTFQVLTKRAERLPRWFEWVARAGSLFGPVAACVSHRDAIMGECNAKVADTWPLPNVHLGVSVEDQQRADERIPELLRSSVVAAVKWASLEPLLGPIVLQGGNTPSDPRGPWPSAGERLWSNSFLRGPDGGRRLDWIVVGGESGPGRAGVCQAVGHRRSP